MKYLNQLSDKELREIYALFLCAGGEIMSVSIERYEDSVELVGFVKEPNTDNQHDTEDGYLETEDDYSLTDYNVSAYHHTGDDYCQRIYREYMYKKFKSKYAKEFLLK